MSDYDPNNLGPGPNRYGSYDRNSAYDYDNGRSGYALLAILAGVALVGGFLYFGNPQNGGDQQAQAPAPTATERTLTETPQAPATAAPGIPDRPAMTPTDPASPATPNQPRPTPQE